MSRCDNMRVCEFLRDQYRVNIKGTSTILRPPELQCVKSERRSSEAAASSQDQDTGHSGGELRRAALNASASLTQAIASDRGRR
jgi:hypothetical protein